MSAISHLDLKAEDLKSGPDYVIGAMSAIPISYLEPAYPLPTTFKKFAEKTGASCVQQQNSVQMWLALSASCRCNCRVSGPHASPARTIPIESCGRHVRATESDEQTIPCGEDNSPPFQRW